MFRKMPFILLVIIALMALLNPWIPLSFKSILYAVSLSLKSVIVFVLPFLIFGLLFKTAAELSKKASKWILFILVAICVSNFISTLISYCVGTIAYQFDLSMTFPHEGGQLLPAWDLTLPKLVSNSIAMLSGLGAGLILSLAKPALAEKISVFLERWVNRILKVLLYVIPVFISGFVIKMIHEKLLTLILGNYALIFALVACAVFTYIAFIYLAANRNSFGRSLKNMLPAAIAGFGSMSSVAAMPLTILGTEKNSKNSSLARSMIPATVNTHLIGDCFAIPIFAFAIMKSFGVAEPAFFSYLIFASYFVLAKFSVAAVPGGGILVMLPVLETYLGFNAEMLSLITALYILFDPVITCANVFGNGGFALAISRLFGKEELQKA